jgi:hypothetical protein
MTAVRAMRFAAGRVIVVFAIAMLAAADDRIIAAEPTKSSTRICITIGSRSRTTGSMRCWRCSGSIA